MSFSSFHARICFPPSLHPALKIDVFISQSNVATNTLTFMERMRTNGIFKKMKPTSENYAAPRCGADARMPSLTGPSGLGEGRWRMVSKVMVQSWMDAFGLFLSEAECLKNLTIKFVAREKCTCILGIIYFGNCTWKKSHVLTCECVNVSIIVMHRCPL